VQVRLLPVGESHREAAKSIVEQIRAAGHRIDVGEPQETIGKRIRAAELEKIPFTIVFGDRESEQSLAVRERGGAQTHESLADFLAKLATLDS
jgi:threonyl-tRNA synthetase